MTVKMRVVSAVFPDLMERFRDGRMAEADDKVRAIVEKHGLKWDGTGSGGSVQDWWFYADEAQLDAVTADLIAEGFDIRAKDRCDVGPVDADEEWKL